MRNIAIIPARSGSKGLTDKNIRELAGRPLIAYTIEAALKSGMFETVMVSTDSTRYAQIAREYGAEVPFFRSREASSDTASSWDVVREVLDKYQEAGKAFDTLMLLQPTSPLRTVQNIREAYEEMEEKEANAVVSLCEMEHSPQQCNVLPEDLSLEKFIRPSAKGKRRQEMERFYRFNGAIYLVKVETFRRNAGIYSDRCFAYLMGRRESVDIDDEFDFAVAESFVKYKY